MGQDYWNAECITRSLDSYKAAFLDLLALCPNVRLNGSGCPPVDVLRGSIEPTSWNSEKVIPHATCVHVHVADLFNFGKPIDITPGMWAWDDNFFKTTIFIDRQWSIYGVECAQVAVDEDGNAREVKGKTISEFAQTLRLSIELPGFGLKDWKAKADRIRSALDTCTNQNVVKQYRDAVSRADETVTRWLDAVNRAPIKLPELATA